MASRAKISIYGTLFGRQTWSIGFNCQADGSGNLLGPTAQSVYAAWLTNFWSGAGKYAASMSDAVVCQGARVYYYPTASGPAGFVGQSTGAAVAGTSTSQYQPGQIALVATLVGEEAGRANSGRVYLPYITGSSVEDNGTVSFPGAVAQNLANFLSAVRLISLPGGVPMVPIINKGDGSQIPVMGVKVDNVLDTQRRRRDKILATATQSASLVVG